MARMKLFFPGIADALYRLDEIEGDLKAATEEALQESAKIVQTEVTKAASKYQNKGGGKGYATGAMYKAIKKDYQIHWAGSVAEIGVGFNIGSDDPGGIHSIFLMYGTPRMDKDQKLYNAVYGSKTARRVWAAQEKVFEKYLSLAGGNGGR